MLKTLIAGALVFEIYLNLLISRPGMRNSDFATALDDYVLDAIAPITLALKKVQSR